jgi:pyruvate formate lyase activating enzyme
VNVKGIIKSSLIDYPGEISSVIFTEGCNLKCRFCHNVELLTKSDSPPIPEEDLFSLLKKRNKVIKSVVISGGEPTIHSDLFDFIQRLAKMGLKIKLDSNGMNPAVIKKLLETKSVNYFAIDIKTSPDKYKDVTGTGSFESLLETFSLLNFFYADYEARTTCVPSLVTLEDIELIGKAVIRLKKYYLQQFRNQITLDESLNGIIPYSKETIRSFTDKARLFSDFCGIRGI